MEKVAKALRYPSSKALSQRTAELKTKPAVVPTFAQLGLEFGET